MNEKGLNSKTSPPIGNRMVRIVLVEPKHPGNVGAVARVMVNFGIEELILIGGCEINEEAYNRSTSGKYILEKSQRYDDLKEGLEGGEVNVGTSGIIPGGDKRWYRNPIHCKDLLSKLDGRNPNLIFGREDFGLYKEELSLCEIAVRVPTNPDKPILNLSHAVGIILYELNRNTKFKLPSRPKKIKQKEVEIMVSSFLDVLKETNYPERRLQRAETTLRRIMSRGTLDENEYDTVMGMIKDIEKSQNEMKDG